MATRKKKAAHGGRRPGAGRKARIDGTRTDREVTLAFTERELAALELARPPKLERARWLADTLLEALLVTCERCGAVAYDRRGVPLYGDKHTCGEVRDR